MNRAPNPHAAKDEVLEEGLRPSRLTDYIGQDEVTGRLQVYLEAARRRHQALDHVLLYGPPGLGKTTLSQIIARELGAEIRVTSGPAIERQGDLAGLLTNLVAGQVLFIDEIHRLNRSVEELLYAAMEDFALDLVIDRGPAARSIRMPLPNFTLVGATTRAGLLTAPLLTRFGIQERLEFYKAADLARILERSARILGLRADGEALIEIARRSRGNPRIANRLLRRVGDYAVVSGDESLGLARARTALASLGVDDLGLDSLDRAYLTSLVEKFGGGPVGVETLAAALSEERDTLEEIVEPFLLQQGFIERTPRGRVATASSRAHLDSPSLRRTEPRTLFSR